MATRTLLAQEELGYARPSDQNLLGWTFDPATVSTANALSPGLVFLWQLTAAASGTASNVLLGLAVGGSGLTAGQCLAGLYSMAGTKLGETADQSGAWASSGLKTMAMASPPAVVAGTKYWVAILVNHSGSSPAFASGGLTPAVNAGLTAVNYRGGLTAGTGFTALPASFTPSSSSSYGGLFWAALS